MRNSAQAVALRPLTGAQKCVVVVGASLFVALCAQFTIPLPFTPVPLTLSNFGVLLVGMALGSRGGFAALMLYLAEGAMGLPVFAGGAAGAAWFLGPTGGYLIAYPVAALLAGFIAERGAAGFARMITAAVAAEVVIFAGGMSWLALVAHSGASQTARFALYPFVFAEVIKIMGAAGIGRRMSPILGSRM